MNVTKKILNFYKIPLLVSITLFIVILGLTGLREPVDIGLVFLGCLLGTFFLDLDYIIYAYFTDPDKGFSQTLKGYFKHNDYTHAIAHIYYHQDDVKEKTLQSVLFQIIIGGFGIFMIFAPINFFARSIVLSIYVNSLYRLAHKHFSHKADDWFWLLKEKPSKQGVKIYLIINALLFLIAIQFL